MPAHSTPRRSAPDPTGRDSRATQITSRRKGTPRSELLLYLFAAVAYIAAGFFAKEVFAWWSYGAIWLVALVWLGPTILRRLREPRGPSDTEASNAANPSPTKPRAGSDSDA